MPKSAANVLKVPYFKHLRECSFGHFVCAHHASCRPWVQITGATVKRAHSTWQLQPAVCSMQSYLLQSFWVNIHRNVGVFFQRSLNGILQGAIQQVQDRKISFTQRTTKQHLHGAVLLKTALCIPATCSAHQYSTHMVGAPQSKPMGSMSCP